MLDMNENGMSDVWELLYGGYGITPNGDPDGDGFSNLQEAMAGTNPYDSNSFPHITFSAFAAINFSVTIPCALGKQYQLQSIASTSMTPTGSWRRMSSPAQGNEHHPDRHGDGHR